MTGLVKVLIGSAVVAGVAAVAIVASNKKEEKYVEVTANGEKQTVQIKDEDPSILQKIKRYVEKKVIKILGFVVLHMEQIEAASAIIGLASGAIGIASAVKEYRRGDDVQDKLDVLTAKVDKLSRQESVDTHALGTYIQSCSEVLNDNLKQVDADIIYFAEKQGVKILEDGEVFSA